MFTGFGNFICHTKYNDKRENKLNFVCVNNRDAVKRTASSRAEGRKKAKKDKDEVRSIASGDKELFNGRGYTMDTRMQMVEIAQFEVARKREDIKNQLTRLTNCNTLLLEERLQEITMAKIICPVFDPNDFHWKCVLKLSDGIKHLKELMEAEEKKQQLATVNDSDGIMVSNFLKSVTGNDLTTEIDLEMEETNKRANGNDLTPSKTVVVVNKDCTAITSDLDDKHSNSSVS